MFAWMMRAWRRRQRSIDREVLWPEMLARGGEAKAIAAMIVHASFDSAWSDLTADQAEAEIRGWV